MPQRTSGFAVCLKNRGGAASLQVPKQSCFIADAVAEATDLILVVDESGEDLFPARMFCKLRALRMAS